MFLLFLFLVGILRRFLKGIIGKLFLSLSLSVLGCIFSELQHAPKVVYIHQRRWASPYWPSCRFWGWSWVTVCFFWERWKPRNSQKKPRNLFLEGVLGNIFLKSRQCEVSGESFGIYTIFPCGCCHLLALVSVDGEVLWSHAAEPKQKLWISDATDVCDLSP